MYTHTHTHTHTHKVLDQTDIHTKYCTLYHIFVKCLCHHLGRDLMWQWNRFTPVSTRSKSQPGGFFRLPVTRQIEQQWMAVNGCITLHVKLLSACQGEYGLLRCVTPGVSHLCYLAAVFPVTKINIWASAPPEGLIFYSSALLYIQQVTDTRSLIPFWWSIGAASQEVQAVQTSAIFETRVCSVCEIVPYLWGI